MVAPNPSVGAPKKTLSTDWGGEFHFAMYGTSSVVVALDLGRDKSRAYLIDAGVLYVYSLEDVVWKTKR